jgi:flagellar basal-body rod modification protein FlgD
MTTVPATSGTTPTTTQDTSSSSAINTPTLDYNAFLQLLLAQMKNQDPLNPTDSTEYVSQLASFSNVEQGLKTNAKLDQLLTVSNLSQAGTLVGHTLTSADGSTSGIVQAVRIDSTGSTAIFTDGTELPIDAGVTVGY